MTALTWDRARDCIRDRVGLPCPAVEYVDLLGCSSRVLASDVTADRDYPTLARSMRDGFAVRAVDVPGELRVVGEVRAGGIWEGVVAAGQAVEIMTGAPVPRGADAIVMVEHVTRSGGRIVCPGIAKAGQHIDNAGSHCRAGVVVLRAGELLDYAHVALLATVGCTRVPVFKQPEVAIVATGDELVPAGSEPAPHQIRNSNTWSLASQVVRAGGRPRILPTAIDTVDATRAAIEDAMQSDILILAGGVSAGKYDIVEQVLASLGAEFYFDRVLIQPGQPAVFGMLQGKLFFGLPGNPASTMVTFELFARLAIELLSGRSEPSLPLTYARLTEPFRQKPGLKRFLPARLAAGGLEVTPLPWTGSGDVPALARANVYLATAEDRESWNAGDFIEVLSR